MTSPPNRQPLVSIIIPVFNLWEYTLRCLMSVVKHTSHISHEVIVVDDASTDETAAALPLLEGIRLIRNETNKGFAHNNNIAAAVAQGRYLVFLNNDTEVHGGWLDALLAMIEGLPQVGMVGSKLLFPDGTLQHAGVAFSYGAPEPITPFHIHYRKPASASTQAYELQAVTAACALMPRDLFLAVGGFDEGFRMGYEDVDLCLRVRAYGRKIVYTPHSVVTHYESLSPARFVASRRNSERLHEKWLETFDAFESDYRTRPLPPKAAQNRAPCAVVVAVHDDLETIAPCLHNLLLDLGAEDELVLVDDGSVGATATFLRLFAERHAGCTRLVRLADHHGLAGAWRVGLQACTKAHAVAMLGTIRMVPGCLERLMGHLAANQRVGVLAVAMEDGLSHKLAPLSAAEGGPSLPAPCRPGDVQACEWLTSGVVAGTSDRLRGLVESHPEGVPGGDPQAWSRALARSGLALGLARDVTPYSLLQMFPSCSPTTRAVYCQAVAEGSSRSGTIEADAELLVSIVIVARNASEPVGEAIQALLRNTLCPFELVIVDDGGSQQDLARRLERDLEFPRGGHLLSHRFICSLGSQGYPAAINQGIAETHGRCVVVMNGDVVVSPGWLVRMLALMRVNPAIGVVAPTANVGPRPQACQVPNVLTPALPLDAFAQEWAAKVLGDIGGMPRVSGVCMAIRRAVIDVVGGFDPAYGEGGGDVEDYCLRVARAGFAVALAREAYVEHLGRSSPRWLDLHPRRAPPLGWLRFCERWNHPPAWSDTDGLEKVFRAPVPFDPAKDHVPLPARGSNPRSTAAAPAAVTSVTQPIL